MNYILLIIGFILLVKGADFFVDGSSNLAKVFKIPTLIIGLTIVAFGTSAPEAAVSIMASLDGNNAISIGNVVGSNICNLLLVLGISALFNPIKTTKKVINRDYLVSILASIILLIMIIEEFITGGNIAHISRSEGLILFCILIIYVYALIADAISEKKKLEVEKRKFALKDLIWIIGGLIAILIGGNLVVDSAIAIAKDYHISENLIAITIVAVGTSLPELVTSVIAAKKNEADIAIGNVIGSNIFNILFVLGISATISPLTVNLIAFINILAVLVVETLVYILLVKNFEIGRKKGILMILIYICYILYNIVR